MPDGLKVAAVSEARCSLPDMCEGFIYSAISFSPVSSARWEEVKKTTSRVRGGSAHVRRFAVAVCLLCAVHFEWPLLTGPFEWSIGSCRRRKPCGGQPTPSWSNQCFLISHMTQRDTQFVHTHFIPCKFLFLAMEPARVYRNFSILILRSTYYVWCLYFSCFQCLCSYFAFAVFSFCSVVNSELIGSSCPTHFTA